MSERRKKDGLNGRGRIQDEDWEIEELDEQEDELPPEVERTARAAGRAGRSSGGTAGKRAGRSRASRSSGECSPLERGNYGIIAVTCLFGAVFLCMMAYICVYSVRNRQELINNNYNSRQKMLISQNVRGIIYSRDRDVLAQTETDGEGKETRVYPYENLFSHVVGYATNGRAGVEALGNYYLINSNAPLAEKVSNEVEGAKYPGDNVITTLDVDLQRVASRALGAFNGAVVVTEPSTGKILAMVSKPDFDPARIEAEWDELISDKESSVLLNRATQGMYPPGSTFKMIMALEYIRENPDSYRNYRYNCNGYFALGEEKIRCYHGQNHGSVDFAQSFAKSCNSSFANIGVGLDKTSLAATLKELMFGQELPLKMNYAKSSAVVTEDTSDADMMQLAIGQGATQMSPAHLNMITCAVANNGVLMKPYVVDRVENSTGKVIKQFEPETYKRLMSGEEADILTGLMEGVVQNGTGTRLKGLSYTAAGKTGSAEYSDVKTDSHAWFTGFAPVEEPRVCVTIIIEEAGSGGDYAVPMAKRIFDAYFEENP